MKSSANSLAMKTRSPLPKMEKLENSTAGQGVFTISCPEAVGKTLQFTEETKH